MRFAELPTVSEAHNLLERILGADVNLSPRAVDKPLVLYGAGNLGRMAKEYFDRIEIPVAFVVDKNAEQHRPDPFWNGTQLFAPGDAPAKLKQSHLLAVCIVTSPYVELAENLRSQGWLDVVPVYDIVESYRDRHPLGNGWFASKFSEADTSNTRTVLEMWNDDISRAHHLQFIAWRRLREEWEFTPAPVNTLDRFFIPEIMAALTEHESFADIGAHTGSVTKRFIEKTGGRFEQIWAIEPDSANLSDLRSTVSAMSPTVDGRYEIFPIAVGSERREELFFEGLGYASQRSELGQTTITVEAMDDLGIQPTFMKLHLEGSELDALQGSSKILENCRPILTATSYHNSLGIWELPYWLMNELTDYKYFMRMHGWCGTAAVVYCVPNERVQRGGPQQQGI